MFARPRKVSPVPRLQVSDVDRSFTLVAKPLISQSTLGSPKKPIEDDNASSSTAEDSTIDISRIAVRTGDYRSYHTTSAGSNNSDFYIEKKLARRMYRVLLCKETVNGKRLLIDSLDGKIYCDGFTYRNRIARGIVLFDSKQAALSERYPCNQASAGPSGNGTFPRILVAFGKSILPLSFDIVANHALLFSRRMGSLQASPRRGRINSL